MSESVARLRQSVCDGVLRGRGRAAAGLRRAAFENRDVDPRLAPLIEKVVRRAWTVTDRDVAAVTEAGFSDDEVFEVVIAAAVGQATRQLDMAMAALEAAAAEGAPARQGGAQ